MRDCISAPKNARTCQATRFPADENQKFARREHRRFLLPAGKGSAAISVPLSVDTRAAQWEKGKGGAREVEKGAAGWPREGEDTNFCFCWRGKKEQRVMEGEEEGREGVL